MGLIGFMLLPGLLAVLTPRHWVGALLASLGLGWVLVCIDFASVNGGAVDVMGLGLLGMVLMAVLFLLALRYLVFWRRVPAPAVSNRQQRWISGYLHALLGAVAGALLTVVLVRTSNAWWGTAWLTHLLVLGAAAACLWVPIPVARWSAALTVLVCTAWSLQSAHRVVQAAELEAGGQAYCLQAAGAEGLRPATAWMDLTGFAMQANANAERHAQMATGSARAPVWRYWSYRNAVFETEKRGGVLTCDLRTHYAAALPWLAPAGSAHARVGQPDAEFWLASGHWRIPYAYMGSAQDKPPTLRFFANGTDFGPPQGTLARTGAQSWVQIAQSVSVSLCTPDKIHVAYAAGGPRQQVRTLQVAHGLEQQEVLTDANQVPRVQWLEKAADSTAPRTWIACDGPKASCHHAFMREGLQIQFMHAAADLPKWKALQDGLWQRLRSFAVIWPATAARPCAEQTQ